jgi:DNA-binding MarR family transcriptional regulator
VATTSTRIDTLAEQLRMALARTARRLRREAASGLSPTLTAALATIERHGPLTPSDVARREGIQRPSATKIIAKLEADGLVERMADPSDGRSCLIAASKHGRATLKQGRARKNVYLAERLRALPAEDRATLERAAVLLEQLLEPEDGRS